MSTYGIKARLADIYREGRNLQKPSLSLVDMGGAPNIPVEMVLKHVPGDEMLGSFTYHDIRDILDLAEIEFDDEANNPNLQFLGRMFRDMVQMRHTLGQPLPERTKPSPSSLMQKLSP